MSIAQRIDRIFAADGRALVLAMDHARVHGVIDGLERPAELIEAMAGHVDSVLANYGMLKRFRPVFADRLPVIMRLDGGETIYRSDWLAYDEWRQLYDPTTAAQAGADAVATMTFLGAECELDTLEITARAAVAADEVNLPVMAEALPCRGDRIPDPLDPKAMADAARVAFEHGADLIKNYYTGTVEGYARSVEAVPAPVLMAGGEKMDTTRDVLETTAAAMMAGAAGVVVGRNIWQHSDPVGMARALGAIIHEGAGVDDATKLIQH